VAILLMSAYNASETAFPYTEPIKWGRLFKGFTHIDLKAISSATKFSDWLLMMLTIVGFLIVILTRSQIRSFPRFLFFMAQPFLFYAGWSGLILIIAFPFEAIRLDGEWLGESSPILMSAGCWVIASLFIAVSGLKRLDFHKKGALA
jgi:hypothetical protein